MYQWFTWATYTRLLANNEIRDTTGICFTHKSRQPTDLQTNVVYDIPWADIPWNDGGETEGCFNTNQEERTHYMYKHENLQKRFKYCHSWMVEEPFYWLFATYSAQTDAISLSLIFNRTPDVWYLQPCTHLFHNKNIQKTISSTFRLNASQGQRLWRRLDWKKVLKLKLSLFKNIVSFGNEIHCIFDNIFLVAPGHQHGLLP